MKRMTCAAVVILTMGSIAFASPSGGLVAYYPFNGNANDESGNGHHGVVWGNPISVPGKVGGAYYFDGIDDYVQAAASAETILPAGHALTVALWMNMADLGVRTQRTVGCERVNDGFAMNLVGADLRIWASNGAPYGATDPGWSVPRIPLQANVWYHVAMTFQEDHIWSLFVDGEKLASMEQDWGYFAGDRPLIIGADSGDYDTPTVIVTFAHATIDEVRIYDRALSADEIRGLAVIPVPGAVVLVGIGAGFVGWLRRQRVF